jgi:diaminohydroxyphosphoribosylaminopyrimidine deaminase / 5-amino-6-(5-phosphoribosylamino)uracil reductase
LAQRAARAFVKRAAPIAPPAPLDALVVPQQADAKGSKVISTHIGAPNPSVACAIAYEVASFKSFVAGYTQPRGAAHAEIMALLAAAEQGIDVKGSTVYVSLEPCAHHGRTPPCTSALIAAGVGKVVVSLLDSNPLVAGTGVQQLRSAGIVVEVLPTDSPHAAASRELNIGFLSRMTRKTPWVRMKAATSLDGATALVDGQSQWITGSAARNDGHAWRARSCAVLTGIGTVLADDPLLNVRSVLTEAQPDQLLRELLPLPFELNSGDSIHDIPKQFLAPRQPHLVIVDSHLDIPLSAKCLKTLGQRGAASSSYLQDTIDLIAPRAIYIYHSSQNDVKIKALEAVGAVLVYMPEKSMAGGSGASALKVDLAAMMHDLAVSREINELHVEAGFKLNGSLIKAGLVDEMLIYVAPKLLGAGMGLANLPELAALSDLPASQDLVYRSVDLIGGQGQQDLRIVARVRGRDQF